MNERILNLAEQAGIAVWGDAVYMYDPKDTLDSTVMAKFAELIVRECMNICYRTDTEYEGKKVKSTVIASKVAEHFGVEE